MLIAGTNENRCRQANEKKMKSETNMPEYNEKALFLSHF